MKKLIPLLVIVLVTGCNDSNVKKRLSSLDEAITQYSQALRWGRYQDAQAYHLTRDDKREPIEDKQVADVRVTGFVIQETDFNDDNTEAKVKGQYQYYLTTTGALKSIPFKQDWWYKEDAKRWFVANGPPDFHHPPAPEK